MVSPMSNPSPIISLLNHTPLEARLENRPSSGSQGPSDDFNGSGSESTGQNPSESRSHEVIIPPRKRSKVSRLCDECRRKKIKCDASLQTSSSSTQCSNCSKTNEYCTFTRVPLKRGPTKGYIRDFEGNIDTTRSSTSSTTKRDSLPGSFSHHLPPLPVSQPGIVLPPIDKARSRASSNITLSPRSSVPNLLTPMEASKPPPSTTNLGHFWKVPYEYSSLNNDRRGSQDSLNSSISDSFSPFLNNKNSRTDSNSIVSDSDDEIYQRKSNRSPSALKPSITLIQSKKTRSPDSLSISSLSSLNNKLDLNYDNLKSSIDLKNLESNILLYYKNYHENAFILPLNSQKFLNSILNLNLNSEVEIFIVDLFNSSLLLLNNNNKNSTLFIDDIRLVFQQIIKTYPILSKDISLNEFLKLLFLSTLILLNYCIVLSSQDYSICLNVTIGIFNDFHTNRLLEELNNNQNELDHDDVVCIYSRLYFNLSIFDKIHAIGFNKLPSLPLQQFPLEKMLPLENLKFYQFEKMLILNLDNSDDFITQLSKICDDKSFPLDDLIIPSWKDFIQLFKLINNIKQDYEKRSSALMIKDDEEEEEFIFDNFLNITRNVKKLINQITVIFDHFYDLRISKFSIISTLIFTCFFKILLSLKNLIISIIKFQKKIGNHDLMSRLQKLETELNSIFYKIFKNLNFANLNILNNLNFINQRFNKNNQFYDTDSTVGNTKLIHKIEEWLKYIDYNFLNLINDVEYGWLL